MVNETLAILGDLARAPIDLKAILKTAYIAAAAAFFLVALAEWLQYRRIRRCAFLVFGPHGRIPWMVPLAGLMRVAALTLAVWGFTYLAGWYGYYEPRVGSEGAQVIKSPHHVVFAYDVSPSMLFAKDAGPEKKITRRERAEELYRSIIERIRTENSIYSVIAFWQDAKAVVIDTPDINILDNIFNNLPLAYALKSAGEKTALPEALRVAAEIAKKWDPHSATLIFLTDGDVIGDRKLAELPAAYENILVFGVGDPVKGHFIDDHYSHQMRPGLTDLAARYGGTYFNANELLPSSEFFASVRQSETTLSGTNWSMRRTAIVMLLLGALIYAAQTPLLTLAAGRWSRRAGRKENA